MMVFSRHTLVIDTSTAACSIALFSGNELIASDHRILGRGHAESLVPMIELLPGKGKAEQLVISLGPGSFTGVRIGIAVGRALSFAWGARIFGYPALSLVAAQGIEITKAPLTVCMDGGHGEWFVQNFSEDCIATDNVKSVSPQEAVKECKHEIIAGDRAMQIAEIMGKPHIPIDLLPDAKNFSLLGRNHLTSDVTPIYGRAPDAKIPSK